MRLEPSENTNIPWARPAIDEAEMAEVVACLESRWLTSGPRVERLEGELAIRFARKHAIAVNNGTSALQLAIAVLGIGPGDEVIVPAFTYVATASAVKLAGATPVFCDIDARNFGIDPAEIEPLITPRTRAVLCTDHGGNPCDYAGLLAVCQRHGVPLLLDGAQSIGTFYEGRPALSFGLISTTSFHAAKTMTTVEGGMVFTDDEELARRMRIIRSQGEDPARKYFHIELGFNFRMSELHAAIGLAQLGKLDRLLQNRQTLAMRYHAELATTGLIRPGMLGGAVNSYFLYSVLVPQRDQVMARLRQRGIDTRSCYPMPLYRQPVFQGLKWRACPVAEEVSAGILNPPMFYGLSGQEQHRVVEELCTALDEIVPSWRTMRQAV